MDEEKTKEQNEFKSDDFGRVIDALHTKSKLSSLHTYQGDVAEYVKDKQESVISIAVKEKERQERGLIEKELYLQLLLLKEVLIVFLDTYSTFYKIKTLKDKQYRLFIDI